MTIHDQAENLRKQVADASTDPEDDDTYDGLKASVGRIAVMARDLGCPSSLIGYLADVCRHHDIEIKGEDDGD